MANIVDKYFRRVPAPTDLACRLATGKVTAFAAKIENISLGIYGRRIETSEAQALGGMTMLCPIVWLHEQNGSAKGRWNCWRQFGHDGWLIVESRSEADFGTPQQMRHRGWFSGDSRRFESSAALFAHEDQLRAIGLELTAAYRQDRARDLRWARRSAAPAAVAKPKGP